MEFSVGSALRAGWETFKQRPLFFIVFVIITFAIGWLIGLVSGFAGTALDIAVGKGAGGFVSFVISAALQALLGIGVINVYLKASDDAESAEFSDLWHPQHYGAYLLATIFVGILVLVGFILIVVPGVILSLILMFTTYIIVDRGLGPIEAMKESRRITKGRLGRLFLFALALFGINLLGALALGVGLLVAMPVTSLATVHAYRMLDQRASEPAVISVA